MEPIQALLWDIDGTLLDFEAAERAGIRKTFEIFGLGACTDEMLAVYAPINNKHWERLERGECTKRETMVGRFTEFFALYGIDADPVAFNDEYQRRLPETVVFHEGGWETLLACRPLVKQYCVTNGNRPVQQRKLRDSGMDKVFDGVFISDDVGFEKPSKAYFDAVEKAVGLPPAACLIVGDSLTSDMRGGNNAGMRCCWFNPKGLPVPDDPKIDFDIRRLCEVEAIVRQSRE
ncbi:MAG: YjjG family noncanonical pyrimidine nucleotidase [Clostridia bacterium]|nr:YjjG family noncanonical pyrimidine nucleotidase [Clostridia bacterium]